MTRREIVLAALAPAEGKPHTPVQVQKLLFLIDRELGPFIEGPHFDFSPYNYGPFDKRVYGVIENLADDGLAVVREDGSVRTFALTDAGQAEGTRILQDLSFEARDYIGRISEFVRQLTFSELVSAIYKKYPEMRVNSVFR